MIRHNYLTIERTFGELGPRDGNAFATFINNLIILNYLINKPSRVNSPLS